MLPLRISTLASEGAYQAAKWQKVSVLTSAEELESLFQSFGSFELFPLTGVLGGSQIGLSEETFLDEAKKWISQLQKGEVPSQEQLRRVLATALTTDRDCLWLQSVGEERYLVKIKRPVIQLQAHFFAYSREEKTFHSMIFGKESIFWGIQFSFPQIFMDPVEGDLCKVDSSFANTSLFGKLRQWMRDQTRPTTFLVDEKKIHTSMRLGKSCFEWIQMHPQLIQHQLVIAQGAHAS